LGANENKFVPAPVIVGLIPGRPVAEDDLATAAIRGVGVANTPGAGPAAVKVTLVCGAGGSNGTWRCAPPPVGASRLVAMAAPIIVRFVADSTVRSFPRACVVASHVSREAGYTTSRMDWVSRIAVPTARSGGPNHHHTA